MHGRLLGILASVVLLSPPALAQMVTITPAQVWQIFCIGSLGNDMTPVEAMMTSDLQAAVAAAWERNAEFERANPGDKPPLGDGLPWRSWPDYADGCTVGEAVVDNLRAAVPITYSFSDYPDANYTNQLILLPENYVPGEPMIWRIDDIDLGDGYTMRSVLDAAFDF